MTAASIVDATTPTRMPGRRRRIGGWIAIGVVLLLVGGIGAALGGLNQWSQRGALDPESAGALGTRALVEILREQGIEIIVARDRATAHATLEGADATLVLPDAPALSDAAVAALMDAATDVVLVDPRSRTLGILLPGATIAGVGPDAVTEPGCDLADAQRAGPVAPGSLFTPADGTTACYPAADAFGLLVADRGDGRVAAVDGRRLFVNESLAVDGNAALAVNLLGRHPLVVWYVPSLADSDLAGDPTLADLTPSWVSPAIALLLAAGIAAGVWRGRRFGPLVAERLPVTVRASETTEGRARLYAHARDPLHAADRLRIATLRRAARSLSLGAAASAPEISDAAADRLGWDRSAVRGILIDDIPTTDTQLVDLSDRLRTLENSLSDALRPSTGSGTERNTP